MEKTGSETPWCAPVQITDTDSSTKPSNKAKPYLRGMNYSLSLPFSTLGYGKKVKFTVGAALLGSAKHLSSEQQRNVNFTRSSAWISFNGKPTRTLSAKEIGPGTVREWACLQKNDLSLGKAYILLQLVCRIMYEAPWNSCLNISFFSFFFILLRGKWNAHVCGTYMFICVLMYVNGVCGASCTYPRIHVPVEACRWG